MKPLTEDTPKPLIPVAGKPIIQHNIDILDDFVEDIIVVAGYRIRDFREYFNDTDVRVVEQEEPKGTADAAFQASSLVNNRALILNGDDIYGNSIRDLIKKDAGVLVSESSRPERYGVLDTEQGTVNRIVEKPENPPSNLVNTGCFLVDEDFFPLLEEVRKSERGELEITDALTDYIEKRDLEYVVADRWIPCSYPWQLINANQELIDSEKDIKGEIDPSATIKGDVKIEKGAEIKENTIIEGPAIIKTGCKVGPNAHIRENTVLEENVKVGCSEVKNSVVREETQLPHFNYVGDSYIGQNVNFGAGAKTANLRNDGKPVKMEVKNDLIDTGRKKLGGIIGSNTKLGVNTSVKPGRKVGLGAVTDCNEKVEKNLPDNSVLKNGEIS